MAAATAAPTSPDSAPTPTPTSHPSSLRHDHRQRSDNTPSSAALHEISPLSLSPRTCDPALSAEALNTRDNGAGENHRYQQQQRDAVIPAEMASWRGRASVKGSSEMAQMVLLTFSAIGITFTWGIEMTYCTPYLLNLGLTKSNTSLVWIAGPLSGLIVQPIVGVIADGSTSKWGRRRPLMMLGTIVVAICLLVLGFTREVVDFVLGTAGDDEKAKAPTIILAVLAIYGVDFAINVVMSCSRSLLVDTLPTEKQQLGAAWFSRMSAIGHMIGYGAGAVDLVSIFGTWLGDSQFKALSLIASLAMIGTQATTCWAVSERVLVSPPTQKRGQITAIFRQIYSTVLHLPPRINAICWAQFWSWIGWFPFLFYGTTWVGETYFRYDVPEGEKASDDALGDMGRIGSTALVIYSIITFAGAFVLPLVVESPDDKTYTPRAPKSVMGFIERLGNKKPNLLTTWITGHLMFSVAMAMAPLATSFRFATALICLCGVPWTIASWAPVAFLGVEVNKLSGSGVPGDARYRRLSDSDVSDVELANMGIANSQTRHLDQGPENDDGNPSSGELSGIYFGILNIFTTLPQFVGTFISTLVFAVMEPGKSPELTEGEEPEKPTDTDGPNAIAVCLFIGAMSTLYAAHATRKLKYL